MATAEGGTHDAGRRLSRALAELAPRWRYTLLNSPPDSLLKVKRRYRIDTCTPNDIQVVRSWVKTSELRNVGVRQGQKDYLDEWQNEAAWTCVLRLDVTPRAVRGGVKDDPERKPWTKTQVIAFANVVVRESDEGRPLQVEIGRLLVHPAFRGKTVGANFLSNLIFLLLAAERNIWIYARVLKGNEFAERMMRSTLWADRKQPGRPPWAEDSAVQWYCYQTEQRQDSLFEKVLREIRESKRPRIPQKTVARTAGISVETMNQIERGTIEPTWTNLYRIVRAIKPTPLETTRLLYAILGEPVPNDILFTSELKTEMENPKQHLWLLSDEFAEVYRADILKASCDALADGYHRYYFVPEERVEGRHGKGMCQKIIDKLGRIPNGLRLYVAPAALCSLRLAVFKPQTDILQGAIGAQMISLTGDEGRRTPLPDRSAANALVESIWNAISSAEEDGKAHDGFKRIVLTNKSIKQHEHIQA